MLVVLKSVSIFIESEKQFQSLSIDGTNNFLNKDMTNDTGDEYDNLWMDRMYKI